jgi:hypothetical protein
MKTDVVPERGGRVLVGLDGRKSGRVAGVALLF